MNAGYKARREAKHAAQKANRIQPAPDSVQAPMLDLMPRIPRLTWVRGKCYRQASGGRKNRSGYSQEHSEALIENASRSLATEIEKALQPDNTTVIENLQVAEQMSDTEAL